MDKTMAAIKGSAFIRPMSQFDHLDLDGRSLRLLVAVAEAGSVTRAAERLGLTQSAVSHGLDKLRVITGDALFVRSGRGIVATAQAEVLVQRARALLEELRAFSHAAGFDPARLAGEWTIAANDLQRDLLLPALLRRLRAQAPGLTLRIVPSGAPRAALLRDGGCVLVVTPRPPDGADIVQRRLFTDRYVVFHDAKVRAAPATRRDWLAAEHVGVRHEDGRALDIDDHFAARGLQRRAGATVPAFGGVAALLRGGAWIATLPSLLGRTALQGLAQAPLPLAAPTMPMFMAWHRRQHEDPAHRWLRAAVGAVAATIPSVSARPEPDGPAAPDAPDEAVAAAPPRR
jgi:DNA-binding transcriptional LysR family regulator